MVTLTQPAPACPCLPCPCDHPTIPSQVTDFAGSMNFVVLAILTLVLGGYYYTRQIVSTAIVLVTRLELAALLLTRVLKRGHDVRFDEMRESFFVRVSHTLRLVCAS